MSWQGPSAPRTDGMATNRIVVAIWSSNAASIAAKTRSRCASERPASWWFASVIPAPGRGRCPADPDAHDAAPHPGPQWREAVGRRGHLDAGAPRPQDRGKAEATTRRRHEGPDRPGDRAALPGGPGRDGGRLGRAGRDRARHPHARRAGRHGVDRRRARRRPERRSRSGPTGRFYVCNNGGFAWHEEPRHAPPDRHAGRLRGRPHRARRSATGEVRVLYDRCGEHAPARARTTSSSTASGGFYFTDLGKSARAATATTAASTTPWPTARRIVAGRRIRC